jgi:hypothetical protein
MYVNIALPPAPAVLTAVPHYWTQFVFAGSLSELYEINALATTYMRLVEAAVAEYQLASTALREFWANHNSLGLPMMHRSISHFETCVSDVHRAIDAYRRLRSHKARDPLSLHLANHNPTFVSDSVASRFRKVRDAIHHLPEMIGKGQVTEGQFIALKPDGPEEAHATEPGQTIKTFDKLVIGPHELLFADIARTLEELAATTEHIVQFRPDRTRWATNAA